jgi:type III secretory pathway component EscT
MKYNTVWSRTLGLILNKEINVGILIGICTRDGLTFWNLAGKIGQLNGPL